MHSIEREPAVAGTFYSSNPSELIKQLKNCFVEVESVTKNNISALIVPHAGYSYSGVVAASAYSYIGSDAVYENIFIIGSSHHMAFDGASVYNKGHYRTPLGVVPVNMELGNALIASNEDFTFNRDAHSEEHTIEVQLPFLQYRINQLNQIVPIIIGTMDHDGCKRIAQALRPYFNAKNLFIISTDLSHYTNDEEARRIDEKTVRAICENNSQRLMDQLRENKNSGVSNLQTSLCGWTSVLTLLYLTEDDRNYKYSRIKYMNSSDSMNMEKSRVVGYQSILVGYKADKIAYISLNNKNTLLKIAQNAIERCFGTVNDKYGTENLEDLEQFNSAFVSVYVSGELRGCIGRFMTNKDLPDLIASLAVNAAFEDSRFSPLLANELKDLSIEISVLSPMRKIHDIDEIELGKHGVQMELDGKRGVFLPQVATKTGWNLEEFLGHLAQDKANIGWNGWRKAELSIFEAIIFQT